MNRRDAPPIGKHRPPILGGTFFVEPTDRGARVLMPPERVVTHPRVVASVRRWMASRLNALLVDCFAYVDEASATVLVEGRGDLGPVESRVAAALIALGYQASTP